MENKTSSFIDCSYIMFDENDESLDRASLKPTPCDSLTLLSIKEGSYLYPNDRVITAVLLFWKDEQRDAHAELVKRRFIDKSLGDKFFLSVLK